MITRLIPSSGEPLPVVGLGTWIQFDVGTGEAERQPLRKVLALMAEHGATLIDSSPMYGKAEEVAGDLTSASGMADRFFYATKVWTSGRQEGIRQMEASMRKMRRNIMDLMQIHNLVDWQIHLRTLKEWKAQGKIRYLGITHYSTPAHGQLERLVRSEDIDFVQFNYSIRTRNAEQSLLNAAREKGVAVIINEPFDAGALFKVVSGKKLPEWASDLGIHNWSQYFLKYIIANPSVTCVIPGTSDPAHALSNFTSGQEPLPDEKMRIQMVRHLETF